MYVRLTGVSSADLERNGGYLLEVKAHTTQVPQGPQTSHRRQQGLQRERHGKRVLEHSGSLIEEGRTLPNS